MGGSLKRLRQGETLLWKGKVEQAVALIKKECPKRARKFLAYVEKHRHRLSDYELLQTKYQISIDPGVVESAIKQIDRRLKISGAQWNADSINQMLRLRCAYLNGQLANLLSSLFAEMGCSPLNFVVMRVDLAGFLFSDRLKTTNFT